MSRRLFDIDCPELMRRNRELEFENERLRDVLSRSLCGALLDDTSSCQLVKGHRDLHAWLSADGKTLVQW